jgi:MerR family copper efflux transcriptional regulator
MVKKCITVGKAAKRTGLSPKAIRLYESKGLLPRSRNEIGYRVYDDDDLAILRFIRQARAIGLHLDEIKEVLDLQRSGQQTCEHVMALLDMHISEIDRTLSDLHALRHTLDTARTTALNSRGQETAFVCQIIECNSGDH